MIFQSNSNTDYCIREEEKTTNSLSPLCLSQVICPHYSLNCCLNHLTYTQHATQVMPNIFLQKSGIKPADTTRIFPLDPLTNDNILKDLVESLYPHCLRCPRILLHLQRRQRKFVDLRLCGILVCLSFF